MASRKGARGRFEPFRRLGNFVYRRKRVVVVVWILALVLMIPIFPIVGNSTSLNEGTASGSQLESVQASNIISTQFAKSVANSTLIVVVEGTNVSSTSTQQFVNKLIRYVETDPGIQGLNQSIDVYSPLYSAIDGTNKGVYQTIKGANASARLLLGVPALYFGAWAQAYSKTGSVPAADGAAFGYAANALSASNATAYADYSSYVLSSFNATWSSSWENPQLANLTLLARASFVAREAGEEYVAAHMPSSKSFSSALLGSITLADYVSDNRSQTDALLVSFAQGYVSNSTGFSPLFVSSSYGLGRTYDNSSLYNLTADMIWKPGAYELGGALSALISSLVSPARGLTLVTLNLDQSSNSNVVNLRSAVAAVLSESGGASGVQSALVTGGDAISYDFGQSTQSDLTLIIPITITLLIVATGLFFRSVLTPFVTLGTIGVALGISQVFIVLVSIFVAKPDFTVPTILLTILIGVGTDYSVFVLARYREERVNGSSIQQA
ncbi:MAG TPA: MMPL family transporter, partial [Nitrososphaerales archaeon]|nr:MMPL family transporter [Nitrososphaerales archaeon]